MIEIKEVLTYKQKKAFVDFPIKLYKNNPYFVPCLRVDEMNLFNPKKMFHMKTAKQNIFLHIKIKKLLEELQELFNIYLTIKPAKNASVFQDSIQLTTKKLQTRFLTQLKTTQKKREWKLSMVRLDLTI